MQSMPLQSSRSTCFPPDKVKWRGKIRKSLAPDERRREGQEGGYGGIVAEMLNAGPEQGAQGALGKQAGCCPAPQHEQQENNCLGPQKRPIPPVPVPTGFPYTLAGAGESHNALGFCMSQPGVLIPQNVTSQHSIPSRSHVLCCPLGSEAELSHSPFQEQAGISITVKNKPLLLAL